MPRRWKSLQRSQRSKMIDVEIIEDLETEPVTLDEVKVACKIDLDYDGEDDYLNDLIVSARVQLENFTGRSFGKKTLEMYSDSKYFELLYGPVINILKITDEDGNEIELKHPNRKHQRLKFNCPVYVKYEAGYTKLPAPLKEAILKQIETNYDYRANYVVTKYGSGNNLMTGVELSNSAKNLAFPYSVNLVI